MGVDGWEEEEEQNEEGGHARSMRIGVEAEAGHAHDKARLEMGL